MGQEATHVGDVDLIFDDGAMTAVIRFTGDFDIAAEDRAHGLLEMAIGAEVDELRLDFCRADFVGVTAVQFALDAQERLRTYGGSIRVSAPSTTKRIFDLTRAPVALEDCSVSPAPARRLRAA